MTTLPLAAHIDAWVCDFDSSAREELQLLAEGGDIGPRSHLDTTALCAAFEGQGIATEQSAQIVFKALLIAGDECERRAMPRYFAQGFTEALAAQRPYSGKAKAAAVLERSAMGQHAAGWLTAEPFFAEVRQARGEPRQRRTSRSKSKRRPRTARPTAARPGSRSARV